MKNLLAYLLILSITIILGCSGSDDSPAEPETSAINGRWVCTQWNASYISNDSLYIDVNLSETGGNITGSGKYTYVYKTNNSTVTINITNSSFSGKCSSPSISFAIPSGFTNDSCKFNGSFDKSSMKLKGSAEIINSLGKFQRAGEVEILKK